uniref:Uncharacterized protein n=1 Tax=Bos mutus grunniens TaxID=30521 RepID=A0A8B9XA90_BOSMU
MENCQVYPQKALCKVPPYPDTDSKDSTVFQISVPQRSKQARFGQTSKANLKGWEELEETAGVGVGVSGQEKRPWPGERRQAVGARRWSGAPGTRRRKQRSEVHGLRSESRGGPGSTRSQGIVLMVEMSEMSKPEEDLQDPDLSHSNFQRDKPVLLQNIQRKDDSRTTAQPTTGSIVTPKRKKRAVATRHSPQLHHNQSPKRRAESQKKPSRSQNPSSHLWSTAGVAGGRGSTSQ